MEGPKGRGWPPATTRLDWQTALASLTLSLAEELLKADGKGVIAALSPSGLSVDAAAHVYHKALLQHIVSGQHERLGDALLAAQRDYADSGAFPELLSIYHLFGDPALRIR
jgi:Peptidase family C25